MRYIVILITLFSFYGVPAQTQEDTCLALVQSTILNALTQCSTLEAGEVCRGASGAVAQASDINLLEPAAFDVALGEWGMIVTELPQARMIVFGEVALENLGAGLTTIDMVVSSSTGTFARSRPDANAEVVSPLIAGQQIVATGRTNDSSWLRVGLPGGAVGWVIASVVRPVHPLEDNRILDLETVSPRQDTIYLPMEGFNFTSGIADAPCPHAPESGILIQTPADTRAVFVINGITTRISGTAYLQAAEVDAMIVHVMEGEADVTLDDLTETIAAGERLVIDLEMDESSTKSAYDYNRVELLPYELLPRPIMIVNNWERVVIPPEPNPLAGITGADACTVAVTNNVNVRNGPGSAYPTRGSLLTNQSFRPTGRAIGLDGYVWWRLTGGAWIRFDVGFAAGNCDIVPMVEGIPRLLDLQQ